MAKVWMESATAVSMLYLQGGNPPVQQAGVFPSQCFEQQCVDIKENAEGSRTVVSC